jgi:hypothetical protein
LPHLFKEGGTYFITFRLLDAVQLRSNTVLKEATAGKMPAPQTKTTIYRACAALLKNGPLAVVVQASSLQA